MKNWTLFIGTIFLSSLFFFSACTDDSPKEFTYVIKGQVSVKNFCTSVEYGIDSLTRRDTVDKNVDMEVEIFKKFTSVERKKAKLRLNDSLKASYEFSFTTKTELDTNHKYRIFKVDIKCPFVHCSQFDSVENCFIRPIDSNQSVIEIKKDTTVVDLGYECYCG